MGADSAGIGIAIVGDRFLAPERVLATAFALLFFFPADEVDFALEAGFFFLVELPICIFMGIFDFEESRAVGCGC